MPPFETLPWLDTSGVSAPPACQPMHFAPHQSLADASNFKPEWALPKTAGDNGWNFKPADRRKCANVKSSIYDGNYHNLIKTKIILISSEKRRRNFFGSVFTSGRPIEPVIQRNITSLMKLIKSFTLLAMCPCLAAKHVKTNQIWCQLRCFHACRRCGVILSGNFNADQSINIPSFSRQNWCENVIASQKTASDAGQAQVYSLLKHISQDATFCVSQPVSFPRKTSQMVHVSSIRCCVFVLFGGRLRRMFQWQVV